MGDEVADVSKVGANGEGAGEGNIRNGEEEQPSLLSAEE